MWQTDWADNLRLNHEVTPHAPALEPQSVATVYLLSWCEHCIECAVPDCYSLCPLYMRRLDRKCARFKRGISPNANFPGLFPYGAEIEFRRWGKLESTFGFGAVSPDTLRQFDRLDRSLLSCIRPASNMFRWLSPYYRMNGGYAVVRERLLQRFTRGRTQEFDEFVIEAWNLDSRPVRLVLETWQQGPKFRCSIQLDPGRTVQRIPATTMNVDLYGAFGMIRVYPENDAEAHVAFSWLDFVKYRVTTQADKGISPAASLAPIQNSSATVKCVIWDLDQTIWHGILGEQDPDQISLKPESLEAIIRLDERGIVQSIASKNDHDIARSVLERLGIAHLFLHPEINWQPKSLNVMRIVNALNLGADSCVFIDDSAFERAEVSHEVPGIRVLSDSDVTGLLNRSEFNVPVTKESRQRRALYVSESERKRTAVEYGDRYDAFLKSCNMEARLFRPDEPEQVERCLELLHRSNQLNLSTYRYTRREFESLLADRSALCICTSCRDRFGEYGIVGFSSMIANGESIVLRDFVLSCRVAQKKLENAWFKWLAGAAWKAGYETIRAPYVKTSRNGVLRSSLLSCGFVEHDRNDGGSILEFKAQEIPRDSDIVSITSYDLDLQIRLAPPSRGAAVRNPEKRLRK